MSPTVIVEMLRKVPVFAYVPVADLLAMATAARPLVRKKNARIFEEESEANSCFVLISGRAKVVISGRAGTEITVGLVGPFELVGEIALLDSSTRSAGLVAIEACQLLQISKASFTALRSNRDFEDKLVAHVTSMLRRATEQLRAIYTF